MSRGVSFERVLEFFDNAPLRVAQAAVTQAVTIVGQREKSEKDSARRQTAILREPRRRKVTKVVATPLGMATVPADLPPSA